MKPETNHFIAWAETCLDRGRTMLTVSLNEDTGRAAYLVAFHASQGVIFEKTDRIAKTHNGVRTEFLRLTRDDFDPVLRRFLAEAYEYKSEADYFATAGYVMTAAKASAAIDTAAFFLTEAIARLAPAPQRDEL